MHAHAGERKLYELLYYSIYFPRIIKKIENYISYCPTYEILKLARHKPFGSLNPVQAPSISLATIYIDFIIGLLVSKNGFDTLLITTDKFTKYIRLVPGKLT
jgi:hypothetical protein